MKKLLTLLLGLAVFFVASSNFMSPVSAATLTTITYQGSSPVVHTTGSLFNISNLNPGDTHTTTITFDNQTAEDLSLTLESMGQLFDRSGLTGLLFTLRGSSGNLIAQSDNLYELFNYALGIISGHSIRTFTLELSVPSSLGNSYQGTINIHSASFIVRADDKPTSTRPGNTGFSTSFTRDYADPLGILLAASLMTIICLLFMLLTRRRHAKDQD